VSNRWIIIPRWRDFQHYTDRDPKWIKNYRAQLADDDYLNLSFAQRGLLHGLRLQYALSDGRVREDTVGLTKKLGKRVRKDSLEALEHAGFIAFSDSKPLALAYQVASAEQEVNRGKKPPTPLLLKSCEEDLSIDFHTEALIAAVKDKKPHTADKIRAAAQGLAPAVIEDVRERMAGSRRWLRSDAAWAISELNRLGQERKAS
jgi:hypothetical protein